MRGSGWADLFIGGAERVAGSFLAIVTALTFVTVVLRYGFSISIPDSYDLSRNALGILIFWGIAVTGFRGEHITVDLVWGVMPPFGRRVLDALSTVFTLGCMTVFAWTMATKVVGAHASGETTYDLSLPIWPFYALAWVGLAISVPLLILRLVRQLTRPLPAAASTGSNTDATPITLSH
ncbi:MAG TPA: TRAP transporter small permease [Stellaceae bacterium]|nr:TRAP transporter small permease [Stellaceae bacterium]